MLSLLRKLRGQETEPGRVQGSEQWREAGNKALASGDFENAARCYGEAVGCEPSDPLAWLNLGFAQLNQGEISSAAASLGRARSLAGAQHGCLHDVHYLLAQVHKQQGRLQEALASCEAAVAAKPGFVDAIEDAARLALAMGHFDEARAWAHRLGLEDPGSVQASLLQAQASYKLGQYEEALGVLERVLAREPQNPEALEGRGSVWMGLKRPRDALSDFEQLAAMGKSTADTLANGASALAELGRLDEALEWTTKALDLNPDHPNALFNRGHVLLQMLRVDEALNLSLRACHLYPNDANFQWNCAIAHLLVGDVARGWPAYESRWKAQVLQPREPELGCATRWTGGQDLRAASILVYSEQGLGDSVQFVRFLPQLAARARKVYLRIQAPLVSLMSGLPVNCEVLQPHQGLPDVDFECPLLSLPFALKTTWESLPRDIPYLRGDRGQARVWKERLAQHGRCFNVGVVWSGNPKHVNDHNRSIPLSTFKALTAQGCGFISLQPFVKPADLAAMEAWPQLVRWGEELRSFMDTASLMEALDMVVTVDTSVAHLAGALGRPTRVLLPHAPDWRWMLARNDSPWYPTMRLCRQPSAGDWEAVLANVRAELEQLAATRQRS
jgi:tetratricopeptide (TPR) repeat protein